MMLSGWKFNKEINAGELLTIVSMVCAAIVFVGGVLIGQDRRIEKNTVVNEQQTEQIRDISGQMERNRIEQKADMTRLDSKLDDIKTILIERSK